jgi:hypothetical protein
MDDDLATCDYPLPMYVIFDVTIVCQTATKAAIAIFYRSMKSDELLQLFQV